MAVKIDGIYPATQVHFRIDRTLTEEDTVRVGMAVRESMSGFVAVEFTPRRIILTSSQPPENGQEYATQMAALIEKALQP